MKKSSEDGFNAHSLKKLEDDIMWNKAQKDELKNRIFISVENLESQTNKGIVFPNYTRKISFVKKVTYFACALILLIGLFVSSAFVSPVMAKVVSKIPFLGQIFESKPIVEVIHEELLKKGYQIDAVGVSYQEEKAIQVTIQGSIDYFNDVKEDVDKVIKDILNSRNYDAYKVEISRYKEYKNEISEEEQKIAQEYDLIYPALTEELEKQGYNILSLGMRYSPKAIELEIPNTETRIEEIKKIINHILNINNIDSIPLKIRKIDMRKREQDGRWAEILSLVGEDLMGKEEYKITGLAYTVYPEPEIIIKTSIKSKESNSAEFAERLEKVIDEFLTSEKMKSRIKNDSYIITILSKDKKNIN
ncbi:DUF4030 domain-containing protein [Metabacillus fastidiosus]|uniref:DUF4030 domain-containing protein n=1 Tax=Metabacillus fastidiosus TaxID=1458 RepID=UPI002DBD89B7|nr:DUF4030 domain-containing protein [Metabacillus fastidiosus]MEC2078429.1 DUF4030 domain-containing protein [Metabacillus fastidiosus]